MPDYDHGQKRMEVKTLQKASTFIVRRHGFLGRSFDDLHEAVRWGEENDYYEVLCYDSDGKYLYTYEIDGLIEDWSE